MLCVSVNNHAVGVYGPTTLCFKCKVIVHTCACVCVCVCVCVFIDYYILGGCDVQDTAGETVQETD